MEKLMQSSSKASILETYGTDLTKLAKEGKLDPVIGRKEQIESVTQILCKRRKNNPCLVGEPGVGKTAIAEGLALRIVKSEVPLELRDKKVISIEIGRLIAGAWRVGEVEERVIKVIDEVKQSEGNIILFIDEVHTLVGAGAGARARRNSLGAANILKPALARGELKCIGATTPVEYQKYIEKDPALERRFHQVKVPEPSIEEAIEMLKLTCHRYEHHHKVQYTEEALIAAVKLSSRYISDRFLPDKAIDLIDEAGSRVQLEEMAIDFIDEAGSRVQLEEMAWPLVRETDIQHIVSSLTGIPVKNVSSQESESLLKLEDTLMARVIGQEEAVKVIARAIRRCRAGIKDPDRPIGSFLFIGPTGVGKTELAKVLAAEYFGCREAMIRLDMSEFYARHTVSKLIGSPPGYTGYDEGGQLTEAVRKRPYTIILFDEIEKAHKDVFDVMLQILDDGRLTDNKGRTVDFKNTLIIMTSNIGSNVVERGSHDQLGKVAEELHKYFRPEFLNRLDDIVIFHQLTKLEVKMIVDVMLKEVSDRLISKNINLQIMDKFRERIADEGYSPSYGARPLKRTIVRLLEDNLADRILTGAIKEGDLVTVDIDLDGEVIVVRS